MDTLSFEGQVEGQIAVLSQEIKNIEKEIAPQIIKIGEHKRKIEHLKYYLEISRNSMVAKPDRNLPIRHRLLLRSSRIRDIAVSVLGRIGHPLHYLELMELIEKEEGIKIPGTDPKANFTAHLANEPRIIRMSNERGIYGLREWQKKEAPEGVTSEAL
jgi:hypothetical protein